MQKMSKKQAHELINSEIKELMQIEVKTIEDILKIRNLERILTSERGYVYCPLIKANTPNIMKCMFCSFGHMTECHYPYTCNSEYCNRYEDKEKY
nr:MAG: hypothetical protein [uncultured archaeon]